MKDDEYGFLLSNMSGVSGRFQAYAHRFPMPIMGEDLNGEWQGPLPKPQEAC